MKSAGVGIYRLLEEKVVFLRQQATVKEEKILE